MILADLGAETIKVEPLQGEGTRTLLATDPDNSLGGMGAYFLTLNRNKKSVAIDLKSARGMEVFQGLVAKADIVLSNFAAGVPRRLGLDFATLSRVNPRIITCTVTGYGRSPGRTGNIRCGPEFRLAILAAACLASWEFLPRCMSASAAASASM
jgi:CoA:oxalate CoA-transferase